MRISIRTKQRGFTLIELLIVIVIVGILATVIAVLFNGLQTRAKVASLTSDLTNASKQLRIDNTNTGAFPATIALANNGKGIKAGATTTYRYSVDNPTNPQSFCLTATDGSLIYSVTEKHNTDRGRVCKCSSRSVGT